MEEEKEKINEETNEKQEEVNEKKEEITKTKNNKPKNNKPLLIVLLIIFMGFIFGCGLCLGKELFETKQNKCTNDDVTTKTEKQEPTQDNTNVEPPEPTQDNTDKETIDINDPTVKRLISIFGYNCDLINEKLNTDNKERLLLAYNNIEKQYIKSISCSSLSIETVIVDHDYAPYYCGDRMTEPEKAALNNTKAIDEKNLKSKYEELFSSNYEFKPETFYIYGGSLQYDNNNKLFAYYKIDAGGTCPGEKVTIIKAYKDENKLYIETNYEYGGTDNIKVNYEFVLENGTYKFLKVTEVK